MNAVDLLYISLLHNINTAMLYNDMDDDEQEAWVQQQLDDQEDREDIDKIRKLENKKRIKILEHEASLSQQSQEE
jgi:hypothetical protein